MVAGIPGQKDCICVCLCLSVGVRVSVCLSVFVYFHLIDEVDLYTSHHVCISMPLKFTGKPFPFLRNIIQKTFARMIKNFLVNEHTIFQLFCSKSLISVTFKHYSTAYWL